jgi:hypothetical protein
MKNVKNEGYKLMIYNQRGLLEPDLSMLVDDQEL